MSIRVVLAFSNMLFSKGMEKLLEEADGVEVVRTMRPQWATDFKEDGPDIILTDLISLYNYVDDVRLDPGCRLILFDTECGKGNIASAIANKKVRAVLPQHATPEDLVSAIKTVAGGGTLNLEPPFTKL